MLRYEECDVATECIGGPFQSGILELYKEWYRFMLSYARECGDGTRGKFFRYLFDVLVEGYNEVMLSGKCSMTRKLNVNVTELLENSTYPPTPVSGPWSM